jgi:uncharacterized Zn finger protein
MNFWSYRPYVPVAKRRAQAAKEVEKLKKKGRAVVPVVVEGRKIAQSFWGKAWCENLERYADFENRLPRGRSYVRNGSVVDLQITRGCLHALVSGSDVYKVKIDIALAQPERWKAICRDCASSIASLVELLKGKLSKQVMERVCRETDGLFPAPREIKMSCSCPDWADMCKHVAATLYGAGARLDSTPELLFTLRGVDSAELIASAGADDPRCESVASSRRVLAEDDVAALFGIEMTPSPVAGAPSPRKAGKRGKEKSAGVSAEGAEKISGKAVRATKKVTAAPSAQEIATKSGVRTKAKQSGGSTPADPAKGKIASTTNRERKASKAVEAQRVNPQTKTAPRRGRQRKNERAAGRTRAAKGIGVKARKTRE